jgi:hypothetical protein
VACMSVSYETLRAGNIEGCLWLDDHWLPR